MTLWRVLFSRRAWVDATEIGWQHYKLTQEASAGQALIDRLYEEARTRLEAFPDRQPVLERESTLLKCEVRRILIDRWHAYYHAIEGDDGPLVTVLCLRSAARQSIDEAEAEQIMAEQ